MLRPVLGEVPERLTEAQWERVREVLKPYGDHLREKPGAEVEGLPEEKLEAYLESDLAERVRELLGRDREVAQVAAGARELLRLLLHNQNLLRLARNFVSFPELFDPDERALFEQVDSQLDVWKLMWEGQPAWYGRRIEGGYELHYQSPRPVSVVLVD